MAVKTDVLLLAESGDVTVARRTAFYTYGKFDVILPEGQEQEETDSRLTDGYIARAHDGNVGRFDFGFIRADATVNIDAGTSDLETQIDSAELRSEGDVFFEGDIGPEGFNGFVPGVDFDTGDIVSVTRWGSRLALPVTDIEYEVSDSGGPRASRVHVSGQLIHDAASRRRSNDEIRQQIAAEKRERLRQVGAVDRKASDAQSAADTADRKAGDALSDVGDVRGVLAGEGATTEDLQGQLEELNQQLQEHGEGIEGNLPLIQAYIAANTARWALQQEVDDMQDRVSDDLLAQQIELKQEIEADRSSRPERIIASAAGSSHPDYPVTAQPDGSWSITLSGVKNSVLMSRVWSVTDEQQSEGSRYQRTPDTDTYTWSVAAGLWGSMEWARVPGVVKSVNEDITETYSLSNANTWYALDDVHNVEIGAAGTDNLDMKVQVGWPDSWGYYRLQIRAGDTVLADVQRQGTSTLWSKNTIYTRASVKSAKIPPNTTVRAYVRRWNQASSSNHRYFRVITQASWTERNV